ncbi:glycosyltransferase [Paraglaciecola agarilytica]|uniref:glycosyltransferase n=1 Tax=Paraglaciecola chathamensis TaxID=368405 RepID=UPI002357ABD2|nr:glycosyltransferase [Paraglaciecola agarilytica]|tara:strand:- start:6942 stop:7856 length:915 start_codon:yes stop_codon:yes gene_type:complete
MLVNHKPLISVVIPVYNAERYILKALRSVCEQSYQNLQIIVLDDGSTDRSKELIESVEDERIYLVSRENRGLIATLNEGISLSSGDYIARMDADDICLANRFAKQLEYLQKQTNVGVVFTGIEYINASGDIIRKKISNETRKIESVELLFGCPVCHPTAMFNMNVLAKCDIKYDSDFNKTEDYELWTRLINITQIGILSEALFQYRIHSESITSKSSDEQRNTAVRAIMKNLSNLDSQKLESSLGVIYNNHQGVESTVLTMISLSKVFLLLNRINQSFSRYKYLSKSYYLLRNKLSHRKQTSLR